MGLRSSWVYEISICSDASRSSKGPAKMQSKISQMGMVGRPQLAANEPFLCDWPELEAKGFIRGMELLQEPVEGFPGLAWFAPSERALLYRNLRAWPHPDRKNVWLLEPLPQTVNHLRWDEIPIGNHPDGLAVYYRGWVALSFERKEMERRAPTGQEKSGDGLHFCGFPFEL